VAGHDDRIAAPSPEGLGAAISVLLLLFLDTNAPSLDTTNHTHHKLGVGCREAVLGVERFLCPYRTRTVLTVYSDTSLLVAAAPTNETETQPHAGLARRARAQRPSRSATG
jgi:hypothetical protein